MSDLIDRQAAIDAINNAFDRETFLIGFVVRSVAVRAISDLPSAQPERKKGKWIKIIPEEGYEVYRVKCDQCGEYDFFEMNYCGNCGADMRGETNG